MRKTFFFTLLILSSFIQVFAQDSTAYALQRNKINALLAERSAKFGQYDESLNARTGIFGFQTKRDIKNSNEILRQIALNDNNIFTELKVLLDYKDIQFQAVKSDVDHSELRINSYKKTIRDLQTKNEELLNYNNKVEKSLNFTQLLATLFIIVSGTLAYLLYKKNKAGKSVKRNGIEVL